MKTFPLLTFAWLLYLAVNNKLVEFVTLATKSPLVPPHTGKQSGVITQSASTVKPLAGISGS